MTADRFCLAFAGSVIAVEADLPDALANVGSTFRNMAADHSAAPQNIKLVASGDGAYEVRRNGRTVAAGVFPQILEKLTYEVTLALMESRLDFVWLHGAAAERNGRAVILAGDSGRGKSTIVTALCRSGWRFLSDELVPWDAASSRILPFPRRPEVRINPGYEIPAARLRELRKRVVEFEERELCTEPAVVGAVVFPEYRAGAPAELLPCPPAITAANLLHGCLNVVRLRGRGMKEACRLAEQVQAYRLIFSTPDDPVRLIGDLWDSSR